MAKKKAVKKKPVKKTAQRKTTAKAARKTAKGQPTKKTTARKKATATKKATKKKAVKKAVKKVARKPAKKVVKKKGVRRATTTTGIRTKKAGRKLGRSRIPTDAPLDVVFQNDMSAREAFVFLGIHTMRELEQFEPDELVMRLTSPAKQTVGRIRKILAMNNRCLADDEAFALEFQERLSQTQIMK